MKVKIYKICLWFVYLICIISCQDDNLINYSKDTIQVTARVSGYTNLYVSSRVGGIKNEAEMKISNLTFLVFAQTGNIWTCEDFQHTNNPNTMFVIHPAGDGKPYNLYIVANVFNNLVSETQINEAKNYWRGKNLDELKGYIFESDGIGIPENGFPMLGSQTVSFENTASRILQIPLEALYAKIVFNIDVNTNQNVDGKLPPSFRLNSYSINNIPSSVKLQYLREDGQTEYYNNANGQYTLTPSPNENIANENKKISFSFYMPEHKVSPAITSYSYPFDTEKYSDYRQRYKPEWVNADTYHTYQGKPTYVTLNGVFTDHHNNNKNVTYTIYLGKDNHSNFEIERNFQYINNVTIRGITNNSEATPNTISVDHRVEMSDAPPFIVGLERETLLDSHFEVRPLRVKLDDEIFKGNTAAKVVVKVLDSQTNPWIRLERKKTSSTNHCVNGKRINFTTNLLNELSTECDVTTNNDNCVWVYIDEYVDTIPIRNLTISQIDDAISIQKNSSRKATIQVAYYSNGDTSKQPLKEENYTFVQKGLYPIKSDRTHKSNDSKLNGKPIIYYIEYFEEYLHDFDSDNDFNQTDYEGMEWGLNGLQISSEQRSIYQDRYIGSGWLGDIVNDIINGALSNVKVNYDFYLTRDKSQTSSQIIPYDYNGYNFTKKIISAANSNGKEEYKIAKLSLMEKPKSAVEYCYNKNKRNSGTGLVDNMHWYLPAIDEMEEIVKAAYSTFDVFQENFYWSSQPAYKQNQLDYDGWATGSSTGKYYTDNTNVSRATKVTYKNGNYSVEPSGMSGFFEVLSYENNLFGSDTWKINEYKGTRSFDDGYDERTKKNRIRAVYKP